MKYWKDISAVVAVMIVGYATNCFLPESAAFPRSGAVCVIVAAIIAGRSSTVPVQSANDSLSIGDLHHISASEEAIEEEKRAKSIRLEEATASRDSLVVRVPIWVGFGTSIWGFGDLLI